MDDHTTISTKTNLVLLWLSKTDTYPYHKAYLIRKKGRLQVHALGTH